MFLLRMLPLLGKFLAKETYLAKLAERAVVKIERV
jgi:hypothetical protein